MLLGRHINDMSNMTAETTFPNQAELNDLPLAQCLEETARK